MANGQTDVFAAKAAQPYMGPTTVAPVAAGLPTPTPLPAPPGPIAGGPVGPVANPLRPYTGPAQGPMPGTAQGSPSNTDGAPAPLTGVQTPLQARASAILGVQGAPITHQTPGFADRPFVPAVPPPPAPVAPRPTTQSAAQLAASRRLGLTG